MLDRGAKEIFVPSGEKRVCSQKQKPGPLALLKIDIDACISSKWRCKKTVAATVTKLWQLVL